MFRLFGFWLWTEGAAPAAPTDDGNQGMLMMTGGYIMRHRRYDEKVKHAL